MSVQSSSLTETKLLALLEQQPEFQTIRPHLSGICRATAAIACAGIEPDDETAARLLIPTAFFLSQLLLFQQDETVGQHLPVREALVQAIIRDRPNWEANDVKDLQELVDTVLRKAGDLGYSFARTQELTLDDVATLES